VVIDLFLSYRAVSAWKDMIAQYEKMPPPLAATVMVKEQLALALNRDEQGERAEKVLLDLLKRRGSSSETCGILGRVYKDRWERALKSDQPALAQGLLRKAIYAYLIKGSKRIGATLTRASTRLRSWRSRSRPTRAERS
jgi:hypothetical protein